MNRPYHIGVIGAGSCDTHIYSLAREIGYHIGQSGWTLVCGGLGGVMEAASRGCVEAGGITVGLLPGTDHSSANQYIKVPIPTGLGEARNALVVRASHVLVAVSGGYGTLSEIALALKTAKPVLGLETWEGIGGVRYGKNSSDIISYLDQAVRALQPPEPKVSPT